MTIPKAGANNPNNWGSWNDPKFLATTADTAIVNTPNSQTFGTAQKRHPMSHLNQSDAIAQETFSLEMEVAYKQPFGAAHNEIARALMYPNDGDDALAMASATIANSYNDFDRTVHTPFTPNSNYAQQYYANTNNAAVKSQRHKPQLDNAYAIPSNTTGMEYVFDFTNSPTEDVYNFANPNGDDYDESKIECIEHNEVQFEAELGVGASSKVFKARWRNKEVAAKRFIKDFGKDHKKSKEFISKFATRLLESPHENVIKIFAFCNNPFQLLTEYMNYGSVKHYVRRSRPGSSSISILDRIEIALQAAKGIKHLHSLGIIHCEITCQNLMMEFVDGNVKNVRVAVTDYAQQQMLSDDELETYRSSLGPLKWMAPECIENGDATFESDIYSFSITMWEIITGQEPYPDVEAVDTAIHVLVKGRRPQSYAFIPEKIQNLLKIMWHKKPEQRPDAVKVVANLTEFVDVERKLIEEVQDLY